MLGHMRFSRSPGEDAMRRDVMGFPAPHFPFNFSLASMKLSLLPCLFAAVVPVVASFAQDVPATAKPPGATPKPAEAAPKPVPPPSPYPDPVVVTDVMKR